MEKCSKCKEWKELTEFGKDRRRLDGLRYGCRECHRDYNASEAGKAAQRRYSSSAAGKATQRRRNVRYCEAYPERVVCNEALDHAIRAGKIIRPMICSACGQANGVIQGHHEDYSKPFDVEWLCVLCHRRLHTERV